MRVVAIIFLVLVPCALVYVTLTTPTTEKRAKNYRIYWLAQERIHTRHARAEEKELMEEMERIREEMRDYEKNKKIT